MLLNTQFFEYIGAASGIAGAIVMALNTKWSPLAFVFWLFSNLFLITYASLSHAEGILTMQAVFLIINLVSIWRWIIVPRISMRANE